ncbi:hypothetical protein NDU88_001234 [Pleurodeles waltl]|uniref:Secreted protein n=1 Tax=Pleurodeles waltl TaxID=8319 RepID=A0AAV7L072_PLEWA|nr:hypothetical protein NDU88_001234 [Pleurodeles waltl]
MAWAGRAERWGLALLLGKVKALYLQLSFEREAHLARGKPSEHHAPKLHTVPETARTVVTTAADSVHGRLKGFWLPRARCRHVAI